MVRSTLFLVIGLVFYGLSLKSDECTNLADFACASKYSNDPTGFARNDQSPKQISKNLLESNLAETKKFYLEELKKPGGSYFRRTSIAAYGWDKNPTCSSKNPRDVSACNDTLATKMALDVGLASLGTDEEQEFFVREGRELGAQFNADLNLPDKMLLYNNPSFQRGANFMVQRALDKTERAATIKTTKESIFGSVKSILIKKINAFVEDPELRQKLMDKVTAIEWQDGLCEGESFAGS